MGTYGDSITQPIPAVGTSGTTYATEIDAFLTEVKTRLESKVPLSSIASGALDLSNNPLANAKYVSLYAQLSTPSTPVGSLQNFANDLYWVSGAGAVKLTTGNAINIAGVNGITGDYGGVNPAQFRFVDVDQEYYAYDDFGTGAWARVWAKNFDIAAGATSSTRVRLDATGVGASYTLNLPTALPATQKLVQLTAAGGLVTSGVLATNENIQLQGTGYIKRGNQTRTLPFMATGMWNFGSGSLPGYTSAGSKSAVTLVPGTYYYPIMLENTNERIQSVTVYMSATTNATAVALNSAGNAGLTCTFGAVTGASGSCAAGGISRAIVLTPSSPAVASTGGTYWISFGVLAASGAELYSLDITTDVP